MYFLLTFNSKFWPKMIENIVILAVLNKNAPISYFFHGNFTQKNKEYMLIFFIFYKN